MKKILHTFLSILFLLSFTIKSDAEQTNTHWQVDHVVIVVQDLPKATQDFSKLGFIVVPGVEYAGDKTETALIPISDGSYLELYAPMQPATIQQLRNSKAQGKLTDITDKLNALQARSVNNLARGQGLADFAITAPNLNMNQEVMTLQQQGLTFAGPFSIPKFSTEGKQTQWELAIPSTNILPFLSTKSSDKHEIKSQPNGVVSIDKITIVVPDLTQSTREYQILLNTQPVMPPNLFLPYAKVAIFQIGNTRIILAQPTDKNSPLYQYLTTYGPGIASLTLQTDSKFAAGKLNSTLSHNANIELVWQ